VVLKGKWMKWGSNPGHLRHKWAQHYQLSYDKLHENAHTNKIYQVVMKKLQNKIQCITKNCWVLTPNILARKSREGPLSYCKIRAELEGLNQWGSLVSSNTSTLICTQFVLTRAPTILAKFS
jgi:hypothetical protein